MRSSQSQAKSHRVCLPSQRIHKVAHEQARSLIIIFRNPPRPPRPPMSMTRVCPRPARCAPAPTRVRPRGGGGVVRISVPKWGECGPGVLIDGPGAGREVMAPLDLHRRGLRAPRRDDTVYLADFVRVGADEQPAEWYRMQAMLTGGKSRQPATALLIPPLAEPRRARARFNSSLRCGGRAHFRPYHGPRLRGSRLGEPPLFVTGRVVQLVMASFGLPAQRVLNSGHGV